MSAPSEGLFDDGPVKKYLLLILFCAPLFVALDVSSVWDANEAFYVQTPREMLQRGDWVVPYFNGEPRVNKPPLSYWLVAIFYKVFGVSVWAQRLAMALLGCISILCVYRIGATLFDEPTGLWSAGVFATTFRFLILSRRLFIDCLLLACVLAAIALFVAWLSRGRKRDFYLFCLLIGLGFLAKGPVALLTLLGIGGYLVFSRQWRKLKDAPWLTGGLLALLVASSWFLVLGFVEGWKPVEAFFLRENLGRYSNLSFGPQRDIFYYIVVFFTDFAPWSFLFPAALFWTYRNRNRMERREWEGILLLACWMAAFFVVFSLSRNKQEYYILPLYPAAAMWLTLYLRRAAVSLPARIAAAAPILLAAVLLGLIALNVAPGQWTVLIPGLVLVGAAVAGLLGRMRFLILGMVLFYTAAFSAYLEPLEKFKPAKPLAERLLKELEGGDGALVGFYRFTSPSLVYYLDRPVLELYSTREALEYLNSERTVYLIMKAGDFRTLNEMTPRDLEIVEERPKLYTTARNFREILRSDGSKPSDWTRPVYLVTNRRGE